MTALQLLIYISCALVLQVLVGLGLAVQRRRRLLTGKPADLAPVPSLVTSAAWPGWREFRVIRRVFEDSDKTQCSFYMSPVDGLPLPPFKPGQYLTFSLNVNAASEGNLQAQRSITRCYSLSDGPNPDGYRVTIKRVPSPRGHPELPAGLSSGHFHDQVRGGEILKVKAPSGQFFIDPDPATSAVLVAGGIGITPMMSMLRWCLAEQPQRTVFLYYGLRHGGEHAFKQVLGDLAQKHPNFQLRVVYSSARPDDVAGRDYQHAGHVDIDLLRRTLPLGPHQFYVCGPAPMMASLVPALGIWGVPTRDIRYEAFGPACVPPAPLNKTTPASDETSAFEIRFARSGRTIVWDGRDANLLDFSERHGVAVDSGCRSGSCGSCETRLVCGTVLYGHLPDHEIAPGHCLLCVGVPQTALVLEA